ncbi:hypothetical protein Tco_0857404 [Tanacetum coccineum]|uniref:Uncharacterized protein n=1 Tax=Tanacetum coccineum TaxID=301880 RepID=A0ABQ5B9J1_9ASTR
MSGFRTNQGLPTQDLPYHMRTYSDIAPDYVPESDPEADPEEDDDEMDIEEDEDADMDIDEEEGATHTLLPNYCCFTHATATILRRRRAVFDTVSLQLHHLPSPCNRMTCKGLLIRAITGTDMVRALRLPDYLLYLPHHNTTSPVQFRSYGYVELLPFDEAEAAATLSFTTITYHDHSYYSRAEDAPPTPDCPTSAPTSIPTIAGGFRADYGFVATMDRQVRRDPEEMRFTTRLVMMSRGMREQDIGRSRVNNVFGIDDSAHTRQLIGRQRRWMSRAACGRATGCEPILLMEEGLYLSTHHSASADWQDRRVYKSATEGMHRAMSDLLETDRRRREEMRELRAADRTRQQQIIQTLTAVQTLQRETIPLQGLVTTLQDAGDTHLPDSDDIAGAGFCPYRDSRDPTLVACNHRSCQRMLEAVLRLRPCYG